jgi:hypothetical protein
MGAGISSEMPQRVTRLYSVAIGSTRFDGVKTHEVNRLAHGQTILDVRLIKVKWSVKFRDNLRRSIKRRLQSQGRRETLGTSPEDDWLAVPRMDHHGDGSGLQLRE